MDSYINIKTNTDNNYDNNNNNNRGRDDSSPSDDHEQKHVEHDVVVDFAEEGRKLLARVNMQQHDNDDDNGIETPLSIQRYAWSNAIYQHPKNPNCKLYVGNYMSASSMDALNNSMNHCRRIVFCQSSRDGVKHFESNPEFMYLDFPIGMWRSYLPMNKRTPHDVYQFFKPLFEFLDTELLQNNNSVLIHCLAGAHRAGTAGIASLMYLTNMSAIDATRTAQTLRPIINPISDFPYLLNLLEQGLEEEEERTTTTTTT